MSRTFRFVQNDDVLKTFVEFRDSVLSQRPIIIARYGDYSLLLEKKDQNTLGLRMNNDLKKEVVEERSYNVEETTGELVSRGVRHACQKMSELGDEDVNNKRFQIWKWYLLDWQQNHSELTQEIIEKEITWDEDLIRTEKDMMDMEVFLHGEYLNVGNTLSLIDKYLKDVDTKEMFRKFAIEDIMEMTSEDTRDKSIDEAIKRDKEEGHKLHTYQFTVSVKATDKDKARKALLNYLAGDERFGVQK